MLMTLDALLQDQFRVSVLQGLWVWLGEVIWLVVSICHEQDHVNNENWREKHMTNNHVSSWQNLMPIVLLTILGLTFLVVREVRVFSAC
jgi:hypothetical protein